MFKKILVPLDGSRFGAEATQFAIMVAEHFNAEIVLLQVVKQAIPVTAAAAMQPGTTSPIVAETAIEAAFDEEKRNVTRAKRYLSGKVRGIKHKSIKASYQVLVGDPTDDIIRFADTENVDLIVMTTHGKSGIKRAIMGSVADAVIRESGKLVMVINPNSRHHKPGR